MKVEYEVDQRLLCLAGAVLSRWRRVNTDCVYRADVHVVLRWPGVCVLAKSSTKQSVLSPLGESRPVLVSRKLILGIRVGSCDPSGLARGICIVSSSPMGAERDLGAYCHQQHCVCSLTTRRVCRLSDQLFDTISMGSSRLPTTMSN